VLYAVNSLVVELYYIYLIYNNLNYNTMKNKSLLFAGFIFMLFVSCDSSSIDGSELAATSLSAKSKSLKSGEVEKVVSRPSANGQGAIFLNYEGFTPGVQHFSFHAKTDEMGNVSGSFETKWGANGRVHGTIDCLTILPDGKTAIMSGMVTKVQGDNYLYYGFEVGMKGWFKVQDNGEGANAIEDNITDFYVDFNGPPCSYDIGFDLLTIQNGNIQVNP
jgi:hypothetical protein